MRATNDGPGGAFGPPGPLSLKTGPVKGLVIRTEDTSRLEQGDGHVHWEPVIGKLLRLRLRFLPPEPPARHATSC